MGVRDTAGDVVDRGACSPAEAFANLVLSPQPCPRSRSRPRPRPSSASAAATPPPSVSTYTTDTADEERAAWTVHRALTSVASPCKHAPTPIASPLSPSPSPSALASQARTRRRPLFGLLARGHRRRSNTLDSPSRNFSVGLAVARAPQPSSQPGTSPPAGTGSGTHQTESSPSTPSQPALMTTAQVPAPHAHAQEPAALANTKASLKTWWNHFTFAQRAKKEAEEKKAAPGEGVVFGKPLKESLKYASVQISTANANGELYVWGYIPVVVAKWCVLRSCPVYLRPHPARSGLYLKENGACSLVARQSGPPFPEHKIRRDAPSPCTREGKIMLVELEIVSLVAARLVVCVLSMVY